MCSRTADGPDPGPPDKIDSIFANAHESDDLYDIISWLRRLKFLSANALYVDFLMQFKKEGEL